MITSEHLHSRVTKQRDIEKIKRFLYNIFDQVAVICYFRRQADMAVSRYSTLLKGGHVLSFEKFIQNARPENYYYNFPEIAENWASVFEEKNCNFRIFPPHFTLMGAVWAI